MANLNKNKEQYKERRTNLIALSNIAKQMRAATGQEEQTLNFFIVNFIYQKETPGVYNTFQEWKRLNKTIKKGEKGFAIWGQPIATKGKKQATEEETDMEYFPLCYLFHESQVVDQKREDIQ